MPPFQRPPGSGGADDLGGYGKRHQPLNRDEAFPYDRTDPDKMYGRPNSYDRQSNKMGVSHKPLVPLDADENPWDELEEMLNLTEVTGFPVSFKKDPQGRGVPPGGKSSGWSRATTAQLDWTPSDEDIEAAGKNEAKARPTVIKGLTIQEVHELSGGKVVIPHLGVDDEGAPVDPTDRVYAMDSESPNVQLVVGIDRQNQKVWDFWQPPKTPASSGWISGPYAFGKVGTAMRHWLQIAENLRPQLRELMSKITTKIPSELQDPKNEAKARPNDQISDLKKRLESVWKIIARVDVFTDTEVIERAAKETKKLLKLSPELGSESLSWLDRPMTDTKTRIETLQVIQTLLTNVADENGIFWGGMPSDGGSARNHPYSEELGEAKARPGELYLPEWLENLFEHMKDAWADELRRHGYEMALELADEEIDANTMGGQDRWTLMSAARQYLQSVASKEGIKIEMRTPWQVLEAFVSLRSTPSEPMGDSMGIDDIEADEKRQEFKSAFDQSLEIVTQLPDHEVLRLMVDLDPEYAADEFLDGIGSDELVDIYRSWGDSAVLPDLPTDPEVDL